MGWRIPSLQGQALADWSSLLWRAAAPLVLFLLGGGVVFAAHSQGLSAEADALAPHLLTVPGEAMLLDPPVQNTPFSEPSAVVAAPLDISADEVGLASWYGARFHKRKTASGELFDMKALTAAHPTLPFGSRVCVRSQMTGRSVVVRINDRGPHTRNRVIDLSRGAAEALGMVGLGLKPVELFALDGDLRDCPSQ